MTTPADEPSLPRKAVNFGKAVVRHAADGRRQVGREAYEQLLSICRECPSCDLERMVCRDCGCYLEIKAKWRSEACPLGKWPPVDEAGQELAAADQQRPSETSRLL